MKYLIIVLCLLLSGCTDKEVNNIITESDIIIYPGDWKVNCDTLEQECVLYKLDGTGQRIIFKYIDITDGILKPGICNEH